MKNILRYKQFESESKWLIDLTEEELDLKENLEFILLDFDTYLKNFYIYQGSFPRTF